MKRFLCIISIMFLFIINFQVINATNIKNEDVNVLIKKANLDKSELRIYYQKSGYNTQDMDSDIDANLGYISFNDPERNAFCIQPSESLHYLASEISYEESSYKNLSNKDQELINLYSTYAKYLSNKFDDENYMFAGAALIWDVIENDINSSKLEKYSEYINDIQKYSDAHYTLPSFMGDDTISLQYNDEEDNYQVVLTDKNGVYDFKFGSSVDGEYGNYILKYLGENKIKISTTKYSENSFEIKFDYKISNEDKIRFYDGNSQDLISGHLDNQQYNLELETILPVGSLEISKSGESISNNSNKLVKLEDVKFSLYDLNDELVATSKTNSEGIAYFEDIKIGKYKIVESEGLEGYWTDFEKEVEIKFDQTTKVSVENEVIKSELTILKKDEESNLLSGAEFEIYEAKLENENYIPIGEPLYLFDSNENEVINVFTTNENGTINISEIKYGTYIIKEVKSPEGYILDESEKVFKVESDKKIQLEFINTKITSNVYISKIDTKGNYLSGAVFRLYNAYHDGENYIKEDIIQEEAISDENGSILFENLEYGTYILEEITAPEGYEISKSENVIVVNSEQDIYLDIINEKISAILSFEKIDSESKEIIHGGIYQILDEDKSVVHEFTSSNKEVEFELEYGNYYIKEIEAPEGYVLDTKLHEIVIDESKSINFKLENDRIKGQVNFIKIDKDSNKQLNGGIFNIKNADGEVLYEFSANNKEAITYQLEYGNYEICEVEAPKNYNKVDECKKISISYNGQEVYVVFENELNIDINIKRTGLYFNNVYILVFLLLIGVCVFLKKTL